MEMRAGTERKDGRLLLEAFNVFANASSSLEAAYRRLEKRMRELSRELGESRDYLNNVLEQLPCGVIAVNPAGKITLCNRLARKLLHLAARNRLLGCSYARVFGSHPITRLIEESLEPHHSTVETEMALQAGSILAITRSPMCSREGAPLGVIFIIRDITQLKRLEEQSKKVERLSAMGEMAVLLAHEIRNPLASLELFVSLLGRETAPHKGTQVWLSHIRIAIKLINNIVSNMLCFARDLNLEFCTVNVNAIVQEILKFAEPIIKQRRIALAESCRPAAAFIKGDPQLLRQAFLNLILNALQAMPQSGSLKVISRTRMEGNQGTVEIKFQDTGAGIAPENLKRIFDPFFTTNKNGNGLGLAVVRRIVEKHNGEIKVTSRLHRGTTFALRFPLIEARSNGTGDTGRGR